MARIDITTQTEPATPTTGNTIIYVDSTTKMIRSKNDAGVVAVYLKDADFTAKGKILVGTAASTFTALSVGSNNQVLTADSAQASGVKWSTPFSLLNRATLSAVASLTNTTYSAVTDTLAITAPGTMIKVNVSGFASNNTTGASVYATLTIDGATFAEFTLGDDLIRARSTAAGLVVQYNGTWFLAVSAGAHNIEISYRVSSGTGTILSGSPWFSQWSVEG